MRIFAIDPGSKKSAWVKFIDGQMTDKGIWENAEMVSKLSSVPPDMLVAIEFIQSYGMAVGFEVFETVFWIGKFALAAERSGAKVKRVGRPAIKSWVTGMGRATDSNMRQALIMRYGGAGKGEPLHGVVKDIWSALGVAVYVEESSKTGELKEW